MCYRRHRPAMRFNRGWTSNNRDSRCLWLGRDALWDAGRIESMPRFSRTQPTHDSTASRLLSVMMKVKLYKNEKTVSIRA